MPETGFPSSALHSRPGHGPGTDRMADPLRHHGDVETREGLLDFAVTVHTGKHPTWLGRALHESPTRIDASWIRVAVRPPELTRTLLTALTELPTSEGEPCDARI